MNSHSSVGLPEKKNNLYSSALCKQLRTYQVQLLIGIDGKIESNESVLLVCLDNDDDDEMGPNGVAIKWGFDLQFSFHWLLTLK